MQPINKHRGKVEVDEEHLRHIMFFEYYQKKNATEATKFICEIYGEGVLDVRKCQRWFSRFKEGN